MFRTIQQRIAIPYLLLILVSMLGLGLYLSRQARQSYLANLQASLAVQASLIGDAITPHLASPAQPGALQPPAADFQSLAERWAAITNARVTIISTSGIVLGDSARDPDEMENHLNRPEIQQAQRSGTGTALRFSTTTATNTLYHAIAVKVNGETAAYVRLGAPLERIEQDVSALQRALVSVALLASLLARLTARPDRPPDRARLLLFALPFVAALCDYLENALHLILLADPPVFPAGTVLLASIVAAIKWVLIGFSAAVIVLLLFRRRRTLSVYG
jgi:two-component system phosphate regulon sensor histidine kinase PhoR